MIPALVFIVLAFSIIVTGDILKLLVYNRISLSHSSKLQTNYNVIPFFFSIRTHFHTINKRNCNLGEINWLFTLLFRGGKNVGDEPQSDSHTRQTAFHNQLQRKASCCCCCCCSWKRKDKVHTYCRQPSLTLTEVHVRCLAICQFWALGALCSASVSPWCVTKSATSRQMYSQKAMTTAIIIKKV